MSTTFPSSTSALFTSTRFKSCELSLAAIAVSLKLVSSTALTAPKPIMTIAIATTATINVLYFLIISPQVLANIKLKILYPNNI